MWEEDERPLVTNSDDAGEGREEGEATLHAESDFKQEVYGYVSVRWRTWSVWLLTLVLLGVPRLVFHWLPQWRLYVTCHRASLGCATLVLVVETYQKKCKSYFIHKVITKDLQTNQIGEENAAFVGEGGGGGEKPPVSPTPHTLPILFEDGLIENVMWYKLFRHKRCLFVWQHSKARFAPVSGIECNTTCAALRERADERTDDARRQHALELYGLNEIRVPVMSVWTLIVLEAFNPFYIFQVFTICVWLAEQYYYYCIAVVLMSTFGIASSVVQTRRNQKSLRAAVGGAGAVQTGGVERDSRLVAPGDVITIPSTGCVMQLDAVLLDGSAIVNESMLTGESVPVLKTSLPDVSTEYSARLHSAHTLYCGTQLIQTKTQNNTPVRALVIRTGDYTSKGELVRSILYPVPADFKFDRDTYKFIGVLTVIAAFGLVYAVLLKAARDMTPSDIIIKALDIITIVIPPALPAAMTVGRLYAVSRLQKQQVYCLNTRAINVSGGINCVCFDKTGTLTEDGLDMWGVVGVAGGEGAEALLSEPVSDPGAMSDLSELKLAMAACHSINIINDERAGDPLDLKMFESTGWELEEPHASEPEHAHTMVRPAKPTYTHDKSELEVAILAQYQFVSSLQRSAVCVRVSREHQLRVYCKGAPETIAKLCLPYTVPRNLETRVSEYAERGFRVIALATRRLACAASELLRLPREQAESDLTFLGLVVLENRLKPATTPVIHELRSAGVHVAIITGDFLQTGVCVARQCGVLAPNERLVCVRLAPADKSSPPALEFYTPTGAAGAGAGAGAGAAGSVDSGLYSDYSASLSKPTAAADVARAEAGDAPLNYRIAMCGDTWAALRQHYPHLVARLVARGAVFARMTADMKQQLIIEYQALGYYVAMCGDGANDCGALRTAHVGISLSEHESSVAAPFTSRQPDIACVPLVLREGRAALATSFGVFKFMVAYSLTEFLSVAFLYYFDSNLTDFQFLFIDVAIILNLAFSFGRTEAKRGPLGARLPLSSLFSVAPLASIAAHMLLIVLVQWLAYWLLTRFPWYVRHAADGPHDYACWENYANYTISTFQYVVLALAFSQGAPHRRSLITNLPFVLSAMCVVGVCAYVAVSPARWLADFLELRLPPDTSLAYQLLCLAGAHLLVALIVERVFVERVLERGACEPACWRRRRVARTPYLRIAAELSPSDYMQHTAIAVHTQHTPM